MLEAWSSYYEYDDGTRDAPAGIFAWREELDLPPLQPKVDLRLNGREYRIAKVVVGEDGAQEILCRCDIGYNRCREQKFVDLAQRGWTLTKEF
jgi:hypothetical protein